MYDRSRLISGCRCGPVPGRSRWSDVRLRSGRNLRRHCAVLQLRYAGDRMCDRRMCRNAVVSRREIRFILLCHLLVLLLGGRRLQMRLGREGLLLRRRPCGDAVRPPIETGVSVVDDGRIVDNRVVDVGVADDRSIHVHRRSVVSELSPAPFAAGEPASAVSEPVVHAAVEADLRSPVAAMEEISPVISIAPIARRPQVAWLRRGNPCSRNPVVVSVSIPGPIAGSPHVVGLRAGRLHVHRQCRGSQVYRNIE